MIGERFSPCLQLADEIPGDSDRDQAADQICFSDQRRRNGRKSLGRIADIDSDRCGDAGDDADGGHRERNARDVAKPVDQEHIAMKKV